MALSADQSALLQTAVNNLNESVEVNKEVLEIVKSVGNTGAVDIATHNNDKNAHLTFNKITALNYVTVGAGGTTPHTAGSGQHLHITTGTTDSYGRIDNYGLIAANEDNNYNSATQIRNYVRNTDYTRSFKNKVLSGYSTLLLYKEDDNIVTETVGGMTFRTQSAGDIAVRFMIVDENKTSMYFHMRKTDFICEGGVDLGTSQFQFKDCYLQNSPIVSSDRRLKQNFETVPEAVFKAWASVNFQVYKFKEAVAKKGEATARKHVGLVAQDIIEAFQAQGLDAFDYGIVCHDSWDDQYENEQIIDAEAVVDEKGNVVTPEKSHTVKRLVKEAGDIYTVRYEEALALEAAYQRWKLGKIEQALAAKGITL